MIISDLREPCSEAQARLKNTPERTLATPLPLAFWILVVFLYSLEHLTNMSNSILTVAKMIHQKLSSILKNKKNDSADWSVDPE